MQNYEEIMDSLCQYGYVIIDDFLTHAHYQSLITRLATLQAEKKLQQAGIGRGLHYQHNQIIRNDFIHWLDEQQATAAESHYLQAMHALAEQFNHHLFSGLQRYECHYAVYQPASFYKKHVDQFQGNTDRQISCVYYLNENWQTDDGGQLRLYNQHDEFLLDIEPQANRLICFQSNLPHEVLTTQKTRHSIAGWFKVRQSTLL